MFKHLGTFAILAVCLFAIVIVMGGCEKSMDGMLPPPVTPETDAPETGVAGASPYDDPNHPYYGLDWDTIELLEFLEEESKPEEEN